MFITLTIDTHKIKNNKIIRFHKRKMAPANGWQKKGRIYKKRTMLQKMKRLIKNLFSLEMYQKAHYKLKAC